MLETGLRTSWLFSDAFPSKWGKDSFAYLCPNETAQERLSSLNDKVWQLAAS